MRRRQRLAWGIWTTSCLPAAPTRWTLPATCHVCHGFGQVVEKGHECGRCMGDRMVIENVPISFWVPIGATESYTVRRYAGTHHMVVSHLCHTRVGCGCMTSCPALHRPASTSQPTNRSVRSFSQTPHPTQCYPTTPHHTKPKLSEPTKRAETNQTTKQRSNRATEHCSTNKQARGASECVRRACVRA